MYVKITNGNVDTYPYNVGQLRRDNPNTSFPKQMPTDMLESYGVYSVAQAEQPSYTPRTQNIAKESTPSFVNDVWVVGWDVTEKTTEEITDYDNAVASDSRATRNRLLSETDWVSIKARELGQTIPQDWYDYRGDLRQIPEQEGFPHNITWPTKPQ